MRPQTESGKYSPDIINSRYLENIAESKSGRGNKQNKLPALTDEQIKNMHKANFPQNGKPSSKTEDSSETEEDSATTTSTDKNRKKEKPLDRDLEIGEINGKLIVDDCRGDFFTSQQERKLKVHVTIDIGKGRSEEILIYEGDDCREVALKFCKRHSLKTDFVPLIASHIEAQVSEYEQKLKKHKHKTSKKRKELEGDDNQNKEMRGLEERLMTEPCPGEDPYTRKRENAKNYHEENISHKRNDIEIYYETKAKQYREESRSRSTNRARNKSAYSSKKGTQNRQSEGESDAEDQPFTPKYVQGTDKKDKSSERRQGGVKSERKERKTPDIWRRKDSLREKSNEVEMMKKTKREIALVQKKEQELKGCTFKPKTNKKKNNELLSKQSEKSVNSNNNIYDKLYQDDLISKDKKKKNEEEYLNETCPFQPQLIQGKQNFFKNFLNKSKVEVNEKELVERLYAVPKKEKENSNSRLRDPITGQQYFHPKISSNSQNLKKSRLQEELEDEIKIVDPDFYEINGYELKVTPKNTSNMPVFKSAGINSIRARTPGKGENKQLALESPEKSYAESEKEAREYIKEEDLKVLLSVFQLMDGDKDNKISKTKFDFSQLDANLLEITADLILDLFELKPFVDFNDFCMYLRDKNQLSAYLKVCRENKSLLNRGLIGKPESVHESVNSSTQAFAPTFEEKINKKMSGKKQNDGSKDPPFLMTKRYETIYKNKKN